MILNAERHEVDRGAELVGGEIYLGLQGDPALVPCLGCCWTQSVIDPLTAGHRKVVTLIGMIISGTGSNEECIGRESPAFSDGNERLHDDVLGTAGLSPEV